MLYKNDTHNPLVLGEVYRSKAQIQMMAEKLLQNQVTDSDKIKKIIEFLCSEKNSPSAVLGLSAVCRLGSIGPNVACLIV